MSYCGPRGIPYSEFIGRGGRWDDLSRDAALAWANDEATRCSGCGQDREPWYEHHDDGTVVMTADGYPKVAVPFRYIVEDTYCPPCHALHASTSSADGGRDSWLHPRFVPREPRVHPPTQAPNGGGSG